MIVRGGGRGLILHGQYIAHVEERLALQTFSLPARFLLLAKLCVSVSVSTGESLISMFDPSKYDPSHTQSVQRKHRAC